MCFICRQKSHSQTKLSCDPLLNRVPDPFIRTNGASWYSICVNCKPITNGGSGTPKSANWLSAISAWCNNTPIITLYRQSPIFLMRVPCPILQWGHRMYAKKKKKKNWSRARIAWETRGIHTGGRWGMWLPTLHCKLSHWKWYSFLYLWKNIQLVLWNAKWRYKFTKLEKTEKVKRNGRQIQLHQVTWKQNQQMRPS